MNNFNIFIIILVYINFLSKNNIFFYFILIYLVLEDFKSKLFENDSVAQTKKNFVSSALEQGMLEVTLISCVLIEKKDVVKCEIKLPNKGGETIEAKFDANNNPFWAKKYMQELSLQSQVNKCLIYQNIK